MRKLKLALAFASAFFLMACASANLKVDESWKQKPSKVKIVFTEPSVANPEDLADDLPDYVNNFSDWFKAKIEEYLPRYSTGVQYSIEKISSDKISVSNEVVNDTNVVVPKITEMNSEHEVYLVINDIWIGRTTDICHASHNVNSGLGFTTTVDSDYECKVFAGKGAFAYYDSKTGKRLAYGRFANHSTYTFAVTKSDWENIVWRMLGEIIPGTPLNLRR